MTVIVAARTKSDGVVIAADSLTSAGWEKVRADRSKLWAKDQYIFGAAGCVRTSQVVKHFAVWPKYRPDEDSDIEAFLVKFIAPAILAGVEDAGVETIKDGVWSIASQFVIAWGDNLARISGNRAVIVPYAGRCAIGSGYAEAIGYLGNEGPWTIKQVVTAAHRATISADGCDGPIEYITTKDPTVRQSD